MSRSVGRMAIAEAEFSKDMVETMNNYFDQYAENGVLRIEITERGLWLPNPVTGGRQFLGLARLPVTYRN